MAEEKENMVQSEDDDGKSVTMTSTTTWPSSDFDSNYESDYKVIETEKTDIEIFGTDEQRIKLFTDLSKYFGEVENPENTVVNTFFKAKYAPLNEVLNAIRPVLSKYGLTIIQIPTFDNTNCLVNTLMTHKDGAWISFPALKNKPTKLDIQGMGSAITYLRRFSLNAIAGVMGEVDDDGNTAADDSKPTKPTKKGEEKEVNEAYDACVEYIAKATTPAEKKERQTVAVNIIKKYVESGKPEELQLEDRKKVVSDIKKLG
ncbi:MAG: ERF family protein [Candidatus Izemoplasmatales bacterium]|nr:ERF family protein [Candidatus Izemoplasmatales bacterium]